MSKEIIKTSDGSATINSPYAGETYHSINGALTESIHIFVKNGFLKYLEKAENTSTGNVIVNIFEVGFGTGLNCVATLCELSAHPSVFVNYYSIEMFPLSLN